MGRVINSGVHVLRDVFGTTCAPFTNEIRQLRNKLKDFESQKSSSLDKEHSGNFLVAMEVAFGMLVLCGSILIGKNLELYNSYFTPVSTVLIIGLTATGAMLIYNSQVKAHFVARMELTDLCAKLRGEIIENESRCQNKVLRQLEEFAQKRNEIGRHAKLGSGKWLFFCPSTTTMLDFNADNLLLVNTIDCRDLQLSFKETERRSISSGTIGSTANKSLAGAAIGGLVFGEAGMIAGSVIGSSGERTTTSETVETKIGKYVVDIYTRLQQLPVVTIEFGDDDTLAKQYYAVISAALPHTTR